MPTVHVEEKTKSDLEDIGKVLGHNTFNGTIRELIARADIDWGEGD